MRGSGAGVRDWRFASGIVESGTRITDAPGACPPFCRMTRTPLSVSICWALERLPSGEGVAGFGSSNGTRGALSAGAPCRARSARQRPAGRRDGLTDSRIGEENRDPRANKGKQHPARGKAFRLARRFRLHAERCCETFERHRTPVAASAPRDAEMLPTSSGKEPWLTWL